MPKCAWLLTGQGHNVSIKPALIFLNLNICKQNECGTVPTFSPNWPKRSRNSICSSIRHYSDGKQPVKWKKCSWEKRSLPPRVLRPPVVAVPAHQPIVSIRRCIKYIDRAGARSVNRNPLLLNADRRNIHPNPLSAKSRPFTHTRLLLVSWLMLLIRTTKSRPLPINKLRQLLDKACNESSYEGRLI